MVNYWCKDLHLKCFRKSRKRHCSLSLLFICQMNIFLAICGCWLLQNLAKRKKSNKFNRLQIEVFFLPNISSPNTGSSNLNFVRTYAQVVSTRFYGIFALSIFDNIFSFSSSIIFSNVNIIFCFLFNILVDVRVLLLHWPKLAFRVLTEKYFLMV